MNGTMHCRMDEARKPETVADVLARVRRNARTAEASVNVIDVSGARVRAAVSDLAACVDELCDIVERIAPDAVR